MKKVIIATAMLVLFLTSWAATYCNLGNRVWIKEWQQYMAYGDTLSRSVYIDTTAYSGVHLLDHSDGVDVCIFSRIDTTSAVALDTIFIDVDFAKSFVIYGYGKPLRIWLNDTLSTTAIITSGMLSMQIDRTVAQILVIADASYPYEVQVFRSLSVLGGK